MLEELKQAVLEGDSEKAVQLTERALSEGVDAGKILNEALVAAMDIVGKEYERGDRYVPEMLISAVDAMLDKVEDLVAESGTPIDDLLVMPLITLIRETFNIPDDD